MTLVAVGLLAALGGALWPRARVRHRLGYLTSPVSAGAYRPAWSLPVPLGALWRHREAARTRAAVVELCAALGAELLAGRSPRAALAAAAAGLSLPRALQAVGAGPYVDVAPLLRDAAARPGAGGLAGLAACWQVSDEAGAGLAPAVLRLADALRDEEQVRREVEAQLAGPRATAVLLAGLPGLGMLLGAALGVTPWAVLTGTPVGLACLAVGLLLEVAGLLWTRRIVRAAAP